MKAILLVDADAQTRRTLGDQLATLFPQARVLMTESGETGLELARRGWPSVVLLDLTLRGMGAFQFVERLRGLALGASVPIIGLAAAADGDSFLRAEAAGFEAFLRKPVEVEHLATVVQPLLQRGPEA